MSYRFRHTLGLIEAASALLLASMMMAADTPGDFSDVQRRLGQSRPPVLQT